MRRVDTLRFISAVSKAIAFGTRRIGAKPMAVDETRSVVTYLPAGVDQVCGRCNSLCVS